MEDPKGADQMNYRFSAIIEKEDEWYVALCPELDVASQGKTVEEAKNNLLEAVELFLESAVPSELAQLQEAPFVTTLEVAGK